MHGLLGEIENVIKIKYLFDNLITYWLINYGTQRLYLFGANILQVVWSTEDDIKWSGLPFCKPTFLRNTK